MTLAEMVADFGLTIGSDLILFVADTGTGRDKHAAFVAVYFGRPNQTHGAVAAELLRASAPIIPTTDAASDFAAQIPQSLHASNGLRRRHDDPAMTEHAVALLGCVGLLRRQCRVFVSNRRIESRAAAMQLHDLLTSRGFDVFLDTHDVRPGEPFQDRARAKEIYVLRVPGPTTLKALGAANVGCVRQRQRRQVLSDWRAEEDVTEMPRMIFPMARLRHRSQGVLN